MLFQSGCTILHSHQEFQLFHILVSTSLLDFIKINICSLEDTIKIESVYFSNSNWDVIYLIVGLIWISLMPSDVEYHFMNLFVILISSASSLINVLFKLWPIF